MAANALSFKSRPGESMARGHIHTWRTGGCPGVCEVDWGVIDASRSSTTSVEETALPADVGRASGALFIIAAICLDWGKFSVAAGPLYARISTS